MAVLLEKLGKFNEAVSYYNQVKNSHHWEKACLLKKLCKYEDAIIFLDKAIQHNPGAKKYYELKLELLRKLDKYYDAISCCDQVLINSQGFFSNFILAKADLLEKLEKYEDAISCWQEYGKLKPKEDHSYFFISKLLNKLGKYEEAINFCQQAIGLGIEFTAFRNYSLKAQLLENLGKYEDKINCYDELIKLNPKIGWIYWEKAETLNKLDRYEDANNCYNEVIRIFPNYLEEIIQNKDELLQILNRKQDTINYQDEAKRVNLLINEKILKVLEEREKYEDSIRCCDEVIRLNPLDFKNYSNKAGLLAKCFKIKDAINCYDQAIRLNPDDFDNYFQKAALQQDLEVRINCYYECIRLNPQKVEVYLKNAKLLSFSLRYDEAIKCYDQAIMLNPDDFSNYFEKAQILSCGNLQRYEDAVRCYDQALSLSPQNVDILCKKAQFQIKQRLIIQRLGDFCQTINCYNKALRIDSSYFDCYKKKVTITNIIRSMLIKIETLQRSNDFLQVIKGLFDKGPSKNLQIHLNQFP